MYDLQSQQINELLTDSGQAEWKKSIQSLLLSFKWVNQSFEEIKGDRTKLILSLFAFRDCLKEGIKVCGNISSLIKNTNPGSSLENSLAKAFSSVTTQEKEISEMSNELENLENLKQQYENQILQKEELRSKLSQLSDLKTFDPSIVNQLREQINTIEKANPWLHETQKLLQQLKNDIPQLKTLTGDALVSLKENNRQELEEAQRALNEIHASKEQKDNSLNKIKQEITSIEKEISIKEEQYRDAEKELNLRSEILNQYIDIDRKIADAIQNKEAQQAKEILDKVESQLLEVDRSLKLAIEANRKAKKIKGIPM